MDVDEKEFVAFFKELVLNPYFSEELLEEFKTIYKANIQRSLDKPNMYASNRVNQIIGQEDPNFNIYTVDKIEMIDSITLEDVKNV